WTIPTHRVRHPLAPQPARHLISLTGSFHRETAPITIGRESKGNDLPQILAQQSRRQSGAPASECIDSMRQLLCQRHASALYLGSRFDGPAAGSMAQLM